MPINTTNTTSFECDGFVSLHIESKPREFFGRKAPDAPVPVVVQTFEGGGTRVLCPRLNDEQNQCMRVHEITLETAQKIADSSFDSNKGGSKVVSKTTLHCPYKVRNLNPSEGKKLLPG